MARHRRTNSWRMRRKRVGWRLYVLRRRLTFASRRADRHAGRLAPLAEPVRVPDAPLPAELQDLDPSLAELAVPGPPPHERRRRRSDRATLGLAAVLVLGVVVITIARDTSGGPLVSSVRALRSPDELGILLGVDPFRSLAKGTDRFSVVSCRIARPGPRPALPATSALAGRLDAEVAPLLARLSGGRYRPEFTGGESISIDVGSDRPNGLSGAAAETECAIAAERRSPNANATFVVTDADASGGSAGFDLGAIFAGARLLPASQRNVVVPVGGLDDPAAVVRRIGKTLGWPDTPPSNGEVATAFDRWASGWIDPRDVVVHTGGTRTVRLALPHTGGTEFVSLASSRAGRATSLEAISDDPLSPDADASGVRVMAVDHDPAACMTPIAGVCGGPLRREVSVPVGASGRGVLRPGESADIGDVHIEVREPAGPYLDIQLSGGTGPSDVLASTPVPTAGNR